VRANSYFQASSSGLKKEFSTPEISEYNLLVFLWEKFGITPTEAQKYDNAWIGKMILLGNAESGALQIKVDSPGVKTVSPNQLINKIG